MNETTMADYLQLPDFPPTYPAPVSFVLRKLEMVRSELVRMINEGSALAGVVMSVNGKAPDESKNVSLAAADVPATEKVDGVDVQTTVQARLDDTASEIAAHEARTGNPHNVTAEQTGARSLADLAVYEEKDGEVEKTEDELVKKSEVGGIVTARQYTDLWDLENGETIRLYFAWNDDAQEWWLSNIEGWNGRDPPPYFPMYTASVSDANITSVELDYYEKSIGDGAIQLQATRRSKNALGLACIGDNVSEFANDAGYLKADDLAGIKGPVVFDQLWISTDSGIGGIMAKEDADVYVNCAYGETKEAVFKCNTTFSGGVTIGDTKLGAAWADGPEGSSGKAYFAGTTRFGGVTDIGGDTLHISAGSAWFDSTAAQFVGAIDSEGLSTEGDVQKTGFVVMDDEGAYTDVKYRFVVGAVATDLVLKVRDTALVLTESRLKTLSSVLDDYEAANKELEGIA